LQAATVILDAVMRIMRSIYARVRAAQFEARVQKVQSADLEQKASVSAVRDAIANLSSAFTSFTEAKNRSANKGKETAAMKQSMVRADVESKSFSAYNVLYQNNSSVSIESADHDRMYKAMADRMFRWMNSKESTVRDNDEGAGASTADTNPVHQSGVSEP
jgi:hypothetical protein